MVWSGSTTTNEAEKTSKIVGRLINSFETDSMEILNFSSLIKTRSLTIQNAFFEINWNVLVAVSFHRESSTFFLSFNVIYLFQIISTIATYLIITCQFDTTLVQSIN
jgi:hypothetical protein